MKNKAFLSPDDGNSDENLLNLTPLIDVVFVVLIMFIIIAPLVEMEKIDLATGSPKKAERYTSENQNAILIHVQSDNSIWVNKQKIPTDNLYVTFRELHNHYPTQIPQLYHDKNATFGTYQTVKNALEASGFEQLDVVVKPH